MDDLTRAKFITRSPSWLPLRRRLMWEPRRLISYVVKVTYLLGLIEAIDCLWGFNPPRRTTLSEIVCTISWRILLPSRKILYMYYENVIIRRMRLTTSWVCFYIRPRWFNVMIENIGNWWHGFNKVVYRHNEEYDDLGTNRKEGHWVWNLILRCDSY